MTDSQTRHEAIVTPSSSLLRTVVSTMGTLTFTSVASFYYYYYRQNHTIPPRSRGFFQSMASLWGWSHQRSVSAERRQRKKSKSPARKQQKEEEEDGLLARRKEQEFNEIAAVFDGVPDQEYASSDVCIQLFEDDDKRPSNDEVILCEDAVSDEDCSVCESEHSDEEVDENILSSAYGMQKLAFQCTAHVVEKSAPLLRVQVIELQEDTVNVVVDDDAVLPVQDAHEIPVCVEDVSETDSVQGFDDAEPNQEVMLVDSSEVSVCDKKVLVSDTESPVNEDLEVTIVGVLPSDASCTMDGDSEIKESSEMVLLNVEKVAFVTDDLDDFESEPVKAIQEGGEPVGEEERNLEEAPLQPETSATAEENSGVELTPQANEVIEARAELECSGVVHEDVETSEVIDFENERCDADEGLLSSEVVEESAIDVHDGYQAVDTEPLTSEVHEFVVDDVADPPSLSFSSACVCDEDAAVVTDDEIFQGDTESHEDQHVDDASDDDASSSTDSGEGSEFKVEGNPASLCASNIMQAADASSSTSEGADVVSMTDTVTEELPKSANVDDDIPDILQLDTLTFDATTVTEDDAHTDVGLSGSPTKVGVSEKAETSSSYIGTISMFLLCGGIVLLSLYYPQDGSEFRVEYSEPKFSHITESANALSEMVLDDSDTQFDIEPEQLEVDLPNMTSAAKQTPFFEFDTTFSEIGVVNPIVQVVFESDTVDIESSNASSFVKPTPIFEFVPFLVLPSVEIELSSEDSLLPVRKNLRRKLSESTKPTLLGPHGLYSTAKATSASFDFRQMLAALSSNGLAANSQYFESLASLLKTAMPPMQTNLKEILSAMREPMPLSKTTSEAFLVSHGFYHQSLITSPVQVNSIAKLVSKKMQSSLKQLLDEIRSSLRVSEAAKDAFQVSHSVGLGSMIVSPVSINTKSLLQHVRSQMKVSVEAREAVLGSHGLYNTPMTLLPEQIHLLKLVCKLFQKSKEIAEFRFESFSSVLSQRLVEVSMIIASSVKLSVAAREAFMGSHGLYGKQELNLAPAKEMIDGVSASIQRSLEELLVMATLSTKLSITTRKAFIGSHGLYDEETLNLSPAKILIDESVSKLSKTLQHAVLGMYFDLLNRVPEQRIVFRDMTSNLADVAGKANSGLRQLYSESVSATAAVTRSIKPILTDALSTIQFTNVTTQSMLGFHGQYFEHHDFQSNSNPGDNKMLFLELWSSLTSCSYFLDHSVVLWGKVGDEMFHLLDQSS